MARSRTLVTGALVAAMFTAGIGAAAARPVEHEHFEESFSDVIDCDDLVLELQGHERVHFLLKTRGPNGLLYGQANIAGSLSVTNPATGASFTAVYRVLDKDLKVTDNGDGTFTVLIMHAGPTKYYGPDGKRLFLDTGLLRIEALFDDEGNFND
jgi:hypothetical protein